MRGCQNPECGVSSGIHDGLTFGSGELDANGYWEFPCRLCAAAWDERHPNHPDGPTWPFAPPPTAWERVLRPAM